MDFEPLHALVWHPVNMHPSSAKHLLIPRAADNVAVCLALKLQEARYVPATMHSAQI